MALLAQRLGRTVIPVVEKVSELDLILEIAESLGVRPDPWNASEVGNPWIVALASKRGVS